MSEIPEFKEYQAKYDRDKQAYEQRIAQMERNYQQQLYQQQQELRNRQMSEMDDYERLQFELNETRQREQLAYQRLQDVEIQTAKQRALSEVSSTMGVPLSALEQAQDINEAWRLAAQYNRQSEQQRAAQAAKAQAEKQRAKEEKATRNTVNTGQGTVRPPNPTDDRFKGARTSQDLAKLYWRQE